MNILKRIAYKLRPELSEMAGVQLQANLTNVYVVILTVPLAIIGLIWLAFIVDVDLAQREWVHLLIFLGLDLLFYRYSFSLQINLKRGASANVGGSLEAVVLWSAVLIFGPTALWIMVINSVLLFIYRWQQDRSVSVRWTRIAYLTMGIGTELIGGLVALWVYHLLGGQHPPSGFGSGSLVAGFAALVVVIVVPYAILSPMFLWTLRLSGMFDEQTKQQRQILMRSLLFGTAFSAGALPFALLGAGIYTQLGLFVYLFFAGGVFLASVLASRLSTALTQSEQRARELSLLEELGRAIIAAPPDGSTLPTLLHDHVPDMYTQALVRIWLTPDEVLLQWPKDGDMAELATAVDTINQETPSTYYEMERVITRDKEMSVVARNGLVVPIQQEGGKTIGGVYVLFAPDAGKPLDFLPATQSLAAQIASTQERARVYEERLASEKMARELEVAGEIQASFLPESVPDLLGWDIAAAIEPARRTSGDFYDFMDLGNGRYGILIADVADKGTGAALYMALSRTIIRTFAFQYPDQPEVALRKANERILSDTMSDQFVTVFYAVLDVATGTITYANAGHNPILVLADGTEPRWLFKTGIPLGMLEEMVWKQEQITLQSGDIMLFYTDGVTEAQISSEALFGEDRLLAVGQATRQDGADRVVTAVAEAIHEFVGDAPQFDDITLVVLKRE